MAWYTKAIKKNIRPGSNDPAIDVVGAILHVAVSEAASLFDYFNGPSGGIESHFYIRRDGKIEQYRNTGYEADANYKANSFLDGGRRKGFVSIETQGMGHGDWTPAQVASIKALLSWLSSEHDFPLTKCDGPYSPGVGYHSLFLDQWSPVAKSCPGVDRIKQFNDVIVPWLNGNEREVDELAWNTKVKNFDSQGGKTRQAWDWLVRIYNTASRADVAARQNQAAIAALAKAIGGTDVEAAVREAVEKVLTDEISVAVNVNVGEREVK